MTRITRARRTVRYAALTYHPDSIEGHLLVHSWHPTEEAADAACLRLVMEFSEPRSDGTQVILPCLAGLMMVPEYNLQVLVPDRVWTWARRMRRPR